MAKTIPSRDQLPERDTWNLTDIYADDAAFEAAFTRLKEEAQSLEQRFQGKLGAGRGVVAQALALYFDQARTLSSLYTYAMLRKSQDNGDAPAQAAGDRMDGLYAAWSAATAFLRPELLALPQGEIEGCMADPAFAEYAVFLRDLLREKPHTLDAGQERLLSMVGEVFSAQENVFDMFAYADLEFPQITGEDGAPAQLSEGTYVNYLLSGDRRVRREAFTTLMSTYGKYRNMLAASYNASVKQNVFAARARGFASARGRALFPDQVPESVYDGLIQAVRDALPALGRYTAMRVPALEIPEVRLYDLYVSMTPAFDLKMPFDQAYALVVEALAVMGPAYQQRLRDAYDGRWIDVYENKGKTNGAFATGGAYDAHPYVLLNYQPGLEDTLTIAHEMGHAMHSDLSNRAQPFATADYTIFAAEVASTVNEVLLLEYLLEKHPEPEAQRALLGHLLEGFRTTVFRQTMLAEFEHRTHQMAESGEALTAEALEDLYLATNRAYYAPNVQVDEVIRHEWSRIPHFYSAFYVYKYATGYAAATAIARRLRSDPGAVREYLSFLSMGGSKPPIEALKTAGVDLSTPAPVRDALVYFEELLNRYEAIGKEG